MKTTNAINNRPYKVTMRLRNKNAGLMISSAPSTQQTIRDESTHEVFINFVIGVTNMTKTATTPLLSGRIRHG